MFRVLILVAVLGVAGLLAFAQWGPKRDKREEQRCGDTATAYGMAQGLIQQRLHDDANPHFPMRPEISVKHLGECRHQVTGHFSSRSQDGRLTQHNYVAIMQYSGNNYWQLESIEMD